MVEESCSALSEGELVTGEGMSKVGLKGYLIDSGEGLCFAEGSSCCSSGLREAIGGITV